MFKIFLLTAQQFFHYYTKTLALNVNMYFIFNLIILGMNKKKSIQY